MRMTNADISRYPKLVYYVKVDLPQVIKVPVIVDAMMRIGGINRGKLENALIWGQGPQIKVTRLVGASGEFTPNIRSNEIRINVNLVNDFENGRGKRAVNTENVYLLGVTLLHELIHWADDQNGIDRPGEEGNEFERAIYGRVVN